MQNLYCHVLYFNMFASLLTCIRQGWHPHGAGRLLFDAVHNVDVDVDVVALALAFAVATADAVNR